MVFPIAPSYMRAIQAQYEHNLSRYPRVKGEADAFLQGKEATFSLCLQYLYGHMAAQDVLSFSPEVFGSYVRATLDAAGQIPYMRTIPAEIFFPYVLYHRVNSECLDSSRGVLLAALAPHIRGKSMEQAALAVNYWCYAHATYTPADDRTLGPLAVLHRTLGRCGEESVLAVSALRSVGIPARQCYCPRWSHCDDNHAWVEVWVDGHWHYLGACEPEEVLDRGWFTAAASRAMLVDTKCWADWQNHRLYQPVNCTGRYTDARHLTVQVTENGHPVADARVQFQVVNYSQLYTLWETDTDEGGYACFETGPGDLLVCAQYGGKAALQKVDLRQQTFAVLPLESGFPETLAADLVPPEDRSAVTPYRDSQRHIGLLRQCEAHLAHQRSAFPAQPGFLRQAAGNAPQVQAFLADPRYPQAHKEALLRTLRPKDFADITQEVLADALDTANAVRGLYPDAIFHNYILAPRVAEEMLLPERQNMRLLFPDGFADPGQILAWMQTHMEILPDAGICNYYPSALGCLRCRQVPGFAFDAVFVALCRAFCFPARLEAHTGQAQWLDSTGAWRSIRPTHPPVQLTLTFPTGKSLRYAEQFTLGLWNGSDFATLQYPDLAVQDSHTFSLQPGLYRLTATTRQIDGTASAVLRHFTLSCDMTLEVTLPEDQTPRRLKQVPLHLPDGPLRAVWEGSENRNQLLIVADPGSEPTEHLLREMLDCAEAFRALPCRILLLAASAEALSHDTVRQLKAALPGTELSCLQDPDALAALYLQMQVGDLRLPFVLCADRMGQGVYAAANYGIRMAQTLLEIQKLLAAAHP